MLQLPNGEITDFADETHIVNRDVKRDSTSLAVKGAEIKTKLHAYLPRQRRI